MIIDLPQTTTSIVAKRLVKLRDEGGAVALGRVLTLVILAGSENVEECVEAANDASREHPCRVIVVAPRSAPDAAGLDAEIRVGGDAGASEVILLRPAGEAVNHVDTLVIPLLLSDAPIVAWWPGEMPADPSADPVGRMAQSRIVDSFAAADPRAALEQLREHHTAADTDLSWTRTTIWRGLLAAALEQPPYEPIVSVRVEGDATHPSLDLLGAWLGFALDCPVTMDRIPGAQAVTRVVLQRAASEIVLSRPEGSIATLTQTDEPTHRIALPVRTLHECLAEELRRLDPDALFGDVLEHGLPLLPDWKASR